MRSDYITDGSAIRSDSSVGRCEPGSMLRTCSVRPLPRQTALKGCIEGFSIFRAFGPAKRLIGEMSSARLNFLDTRASASERNAEVAAKSMN